MKPGIYLPSRPPQERNLNKVQGHDCLTIRTRRGLFTRDKSFSEPAMKVSPHLSSDDFPCDIDDALGQMSTQGFYGGEYPMTDSLSLSGHPVVEETKFYQQLQVQELCKPSEGVTGKRIFPELDERPRKISGNGFARNNKDLRMQNSIPQDVPGSVALSHNDHNAIPVPGPISPLRTSFDDGAVDTRHSVKGLSSPPSKTISPNTSFTTSFGSTNPTEYSSQDVDMCNLLIRIEPKKAPLTRSNSTECSSKSATYAKKVEIVVHEPPESPKKPVRGLYGQRPSVSAPTKSSNVVDSILEKQLHQMSPFASE